MIKQHGTEHAVYAYRGQPAPELIVGAKNGVHSWATLMKQRLAELEGEQ